MVVLVLNAGSNSLKFDVVDADRGQRAPSTAKRLFSGVIEDIGKDAVLVIGDERTGSGRVLSAVRKALGDLFFRSSSPTE